MQAGYTANFVAGTIRLTKAQIENLLGTTDSATLHPSIDVLNAGFIPNTPTYDGSGNLLYVDISHVWVQVNISGTDYVFDPTFKTLDYTASVDIGSITGFDLSTLQSQAQAGATVTPDYIQNLNSGNINNLFKEYGTNLLDWIRTNNFAAGMEDIIGGSDIQPLAPGPVRQTSLPYQKPGSSITIWTAIPDAYRTTYEVAFADFDQTFFSDDIYGQRLTIYFQEDGTPILSLAGTAIAFGTPQLPDTFVTATFTISPLVGTWTQQIYTDPNGVYLLGNSYGPTSQSMVDYHKQIFLQNYVTNGDNPTGEAVLGEELAMLFFMHSSQHNKVEEIFDQLGSTSFFWYTFAGIAGYNGVFQGPYFDLFVDLAAVSRVGDTNTTLNVFIADFFMLSAFEAGIMQQNFPSTGISTSRLLDVANTLGQQLFIANTTNWNSTVRPALVNWDSFLSEFDALIADLVTLIIHQDGQTTINSFVGGSWIEAKGTNFGFEITGNVLGGSPSEPVNPFDMPEIFTFAPDTTEIGAYGPVAEFLSAEPIGLFSGNFYYNRTDFSVGSGQFPYSLAFSRSYNSALVDILGPVGYGWTHNFAANIRPGSNGLRACGEVSPKEAAAAIALAYGFIQLGLGNGGGSPNLLDYLIAATGSMWLMDAITNNAVVVNDGGQSRTFIQLVDGSYNPPPAYADTFVANGDGTFTLKNPQQQTWNFGTTGLIETFVDPAGVTITYSYDVSDNLISVTNGLGRTLTFAYTGSLVSSVSDGNGRSVSFTFDSFDNLNTFTDAAGNTITYTYSNGGLGPVEQIFLPANPSVAVLSNVYDSLGRVMSQSGSNTGTSNFFFAGSRSEEVNPLGNTHVMYNNGLGSVVRDINALGQETDYEYDGLNRLVATTYPELNALALTYDINNNVLSRTWQPKPGSVLPNIVQLFTYNSTWNRVSTFTDGVGNTTGFSYDATQGTLLTITRTMIGGMTPTVIYTYNSRGQVLTRTDETGIVDSLVYSGSNETLTSATRDYGGSGHLNLETLFGYDAVGNVNSVTDPRGNATTFGFDNERRLIQRTESAPFSFVTNWVYDFNGNRTSIQRQTGDITHPLQIWNFAYLANNTLETITDPANNALNYAYNTNNWLISRTDAENREWQFAYDQLGRNSTVTDPMSNISQVRTYTANGMLAAIEDVRSNITTFQYDGFDRLSKRIYPDSTFEQNTYNANSQILTLLTRKDDTVTNTYDVLTRLSTRQPGSLALQTMTYDLAGRLLQVSTPVSGSDPASGNYQFSYDSAGRLLVQTMPNGNTVTYQLDANGNRTRLIWPDSYFADYVFDQLNRLTDIKLDGIATSAVSFEYDDLSRRTQLTYENGCVCTYAYALNNDMESLEQAFVGSSVSFGFDYNKVHQVIGLSVSDSSFMWEPSASSITAYATVNNLNQYPSVGGTPYGYDNNGCLTSGLLNASYDALNRMTQAVSGSNTNNYWYDPLNRQAQKSVNSVKTGFLYDGVRLVANYDGSGTLRNRYVPGARFDEVLTNVSSSATTFNHMDRLGSIIAQTDTAGAVLNKYQYSPFGETPSLAGSNFGFTGQRYDSEIGLYNYKARYYAPSIGRFLQPDPLGYAAGDMNLYSYVNNDAANLTDPLGLAPGLGGGSGGGGSGGSNLNAPWPWDYGQPYGPTWHIVGTAPADGNSSNQLPNSSVLPSNNFVPTVQVGNTVIRFDYPVPEDPNNQPIYWHTDTQYYDPGTGRLYTEEVNYQNGTEVHRTLIYDNPTAVPANPYPVGPSNPIENPSVPPFLRPVPPMFQPDYRSYTNPA